MSDQPPLLVRPCQIHMRDAVAPPRLQMRDDAGPCGSDQAWSTPNRTQSSGTRTGARIAIYAEEEKDEPDGSRHCILSRFGVFTSIFSKEESYVAPAMSAGALESFPVSPCSGAPSCCGFVAAALNDCSKSAMISSICSVPTDIRIRSCSQN